MSGNTPTSVFTNITDTHDDDALLGVSTTQLHFPKPYTAQSTANFELINRHPEKYIAYKVMSMDPKRYIVNPTSGILAPGSGSGDIGGSGGNIGGGGGSPTSKATSGTSSTSGSTASQSSTKVQLTMLPLANNAQALSDFMRTRQKFMVKWRLLEGVPAAGVKNADEYPGSPVMSNIKIGCSFDQQASLSVHSAEGPEEEVAAMVAPGRLCQPIEAIKPAEAPRQSSTSVENAAAAALEGVAQGLGGLLAIDRPNPYIAAILGMLAVIIVILLVK
ncbi:hypothetical protein TYRP_016187 [Tyrophagus putrescentiae]|nr:hypothetical protein TYRP_016187 [Tyrophagus putrescentiae]